MWMIKIKIDVAQAPKKQKQNNPPNPQVIIIKNIYEILDRLLCWDIPYCDI
jgi:hypothetical protein